MTIFVDDVRHPFGRMVMCHMWADTLDELLVMADRIGVQRKWLQQPPNASWIHFDNRTYAAALDWHCGCGESGAIDAIRQPCR